MLKDITLGQFFPGNSVIHKMDPRTKLLLLIVYIVALFLAESWISYGVMLLFLATVIKISEIPVKSILRGMNIQKIFMPECYAARLFAGKLSEKVSGDMV